MNSARHLPGGLLTSSDEVAPFDRGNGVTTVPYVGKWNCEANVAPTGQTRFQGWALACPRTRTTSKSPRICRNVTESAGRTSEAIRYDGFEITPGADAPDDWALRRSGRLLSAELNPDQACDRTEVGRFRTSEGLLWTRIHLRVASSARGKWPANPSGDLRAAPELPLGASPPATAPPRGGLPSTWLQGRRSATSPRSARPRGPGPLPRQPRHRQRHRDRSRLLASTGLNIRKENAALHHNLGLGRSAQRSGETQWKRSSFMRLHLKPQFRGQVPPQGSGP